MSTLLVNDDRKEAPSNSSVLARTMMHWLAVAACAGLPMSFANAADLPTGGKPGTHAFILSNVYFGATSEPNGCSELTPGGPEVFLKSLPPEQQKEFSTPDKHDALFQLMESQLGFKTFLMMPRHLISAAGKPQRWPFLPIDADLKTIRIDDVREQAGIPAGKGAIVSNGRIVTYDSCTDPADFPMLNRGFQPYGGKVAFGMNLDGKSRRGDFVNSLGEKGVDNETWRVLGCAKHFREFGNPENAATTLFSVVAPTLIEITGIDDIRNDDNVDVAVHASVDPLLADNRGRALANASFTIDARPEFNAHTRGRIVDGVLITEPVDIHLRVKEQVLDTVRDLRGARIRATLKSDGSIEGGFYGYYTLDSLYESIREMTQLGANLSSLSCPTLYSALHRYADGYPDPNTGKNTAISTALNFVGVSAFAIH